jgi:hypothetical protein
VNEAATDSVVREGGCHCGHVRYRITAPPDPVVHCHCTDCQRSAGAAFVSWSEVALDNFEWIAGEPVTRAHPSDTSPRVERTFCPRCGSTLTFYRSGADRIDFTAVSFDDQDVLEAEAHLFVSSAVRWFEIGDDLEQHDKLRFPVR